MKPADAGQSRRLTLRDLQACVQQRRVHEQQHADRARIGMRVGVLQVLHAEHRAQPRFQAFPFQVLGCPANGLHQQIEVAHLVSAQPRLLHHFDTQIAAYPLLPDLLQETQSR